MSRAWSREEQSAHEAAWAQIHLWVINNVQDLSELISCLEPSHGGIPILLKHYLKLGGKFLGFSIDPSFSKVMDALIMVDLAQTNRTLLERYMGREGADSFLRFHNLVSYRACA